MELNFVFNHASVSLLDPVYQPGEICLSIYAACMFKIYVLLFASHLLACTKMYGSLKIQAIRKSLRAIEHVQRSVEHRAYALIQPVGR